MIDFDAPPRTPGYFGRPTDEVSDLAFYKALEAIAAVADGEVQPVRTLDYVEGASRLGFTFGAYDQDHERILCVSYGTVLMEPAAGLLAARLARLTDLRPQFSPYGFTATVPFGFRAEPLVLSKRPAPDEPATDFDIAADRFLEQTVGGMLSQHRERPRDAGYTNQTNPSWRDKVYGVVGLNATVSHTFQRMPGAADGDRQEVGTLRFRLTGVGGRDLLPHMVDLPPFVRRHSLVPMIGGPDQYGYRQFLFFNKQDG